jgi:hypothetical protein
MSLAEREPDFTSYSLAELYDIREHLDAHAYPERAQAVQRLIAEKEGSGIREVRPEPPLWWPIALSLLVCAAVLGAWISRGWRAGLIAALLAFVYVGVDLAFFGYFDGSHRRR